GRERAVPFRQQEAARQGYVTGGAHDGHFFLGVREGRFRILRPSGGGSVVAAFQAEVELLARLAERAGDGITAHCAFKTGVAGYTGNGEGDAVTGDGDVGKRVVE